MISFYYVYLIVLLDQNFIVLNLKELFHFHLKN